MLFSGDDALKPAQKLSVEESQDDAIVYDA